MNYKEFPSLSVKEFLIMEMLVENEEMSGLEMVEESESELKKGTIYVTLQRIFDKNLLVSREEKVAKMKAESHTECISRQNTAKEFLKLRKLLLNI